MAKRFLWILLLCTPGAQLCAQDLKGGEITATDVSPLTVSADVKLYVQASNDTHRPYITLDWGDGIWDTLHYIGYSNLVNNTYLYTYNHSHTYLGPGTYVLSCRDSFRIAGIANVSSSETEQLYFQTMITLAPYVGINSTPLLTSYQTDGGYAAGQVIFNPGAYDPDNDSLSYSLAPCFTSNYTFPNAYINPVTGDFSMPAASQDSIYAVNIRVDEWKRFSNGQYFLVGTVYRNMIVDVPALTSTENVFSSAAIDIFPNPANDQVTITFGATSQENVSLQILNSLGETVLQEKLPAAEQQHTLDLSSLSAGIYFITLHSDQSSFSQKLVIQR